MNIARIIYSPKFLREYKKLPKEIKLIAEKKEIIFRKNPFDKILDTHKLHGKLKDFWAFSIDNRHRIMFEYSKNEEVYFHLIGNHDIYD